MNLSTILSSASDSILAKEILVSYEEVEKNYLAKKWKFAELDAGHFVEHLRRFIEFKLFGVYIPIGQNMNTFNEQELRRYESANGNESYRILIPRVLFFINTIRNKRSVGHTGIVKPNQIDATIVFSATKWSLAELIRLNSTLTLQQTEQILENITKRTIDIIWKHKGITRVLNTRLGIEAKILVLLYDTSPQKTKKLLTNTKYSNKTIFYKKIKELDQKLLIEHKSNFTCILTPLGEQKAEEIIIKNKINF